MEEQSIKDRIDITFRKMYAQIVDSTFQCDCEALGRLCARLHATGLISKESYGNIIREKEIFERSK